MKKIIIGIAIALVFIAGGVGAFLIFKADSNTMTETHSTTGAKSSKKYADVDACSILTEGIAKEILGDNITNKAVPISQLSPQISSSICAYGTKPTDNNSSTPSINVVQLIAYVPKSPEGETLLKSQYSEGSGYQKVDGFGDDAFYNPDFKQLNVRKGSNTYIVVSYQGTYTNATLDSNKELAKKLQFK